MTGLPYGSPRFWLENLVLTLTIAAVHFCAYTSLWGIAFVAGEGGRIVPAWLGWLVTTLGFPVILLGSYLLAQLPHSIRGPLLGHGMGIFYMPAGINALLCGAWTTAQVRVVPSLFRILRRSITSRLASQRA